MCMLLCEYVAFNLPWYISLSQPIVLEYIASVNRCVLILSLSLPLSHTHTPIDTPTSPLSHTHTHIYLSLASVTTEVLNIYHIYLRTSNIITLIYHNMVGMLCLNHQGMSARTISLLS